MKTVSLLAFILIGGLYACSNPGPDEIALPVLTTAKIEAITPHTAMTGGNISSDAGNAVIARGICWSINPNPSTADSKTSDGTGIGNYSSLLTGLLPNTTYYVRAYATNDHGTAYGNELNFASQPESLTTVTDIDGNVYNIVTIGSQVWMKENLKTTHYSNGEEIPTTPSDGPWETTSSGAFIIYNNDPATDSLYGKLYNWYAGNDSRKIAPQGWHVPSLEEWETLIYRLGGYSIAGGALKETGTNHWNAPNVGATNSSGFNALPGGTCLSEVTFDLLGNNGYWWTSTEYLTGSIDAEAMLLFNNTPEAAQITGPKQFGASIRCIKD